VYACSLLALLTSLLLTAKEQHERVAPLDGSHPGNLDTRDFAPWVLTPLGFSAPATKAGLTVKP
jgi:hypothetical protein